MSVVDDVVARSRRPLLRIVDAPAFKTAGVAAIAAGFLLSVVFRDVFAKVGITPPSIILGGILIISAVGCGADVLHPARILASILALGFVVGPIVHALTDLYALPNGSERQRADLERATWIILAGATLAMLSMRATLREDWATDFRGRRPRRISRDAVGPALSVAGVGVAAIGGYLMLIGISSVSLAGRGATYAVIPDEGRKVYLALIAPVGLGGLFVIAARALERGCRLPFVVATGAAIGLSVLIALPGSRASFLYGIIPLFLMYCAYRGLPRRRWLIALAAFLVVVLAYGSALRNADARSAVGRDPWRALEANRPDADSLARLFVIDIAHTEPLLGAIDAYPSTRPFLGGESAAIGFTGPIGWRFAREIGLRVDPPAGVTLTAAAYGRDPSTFGAGLTATFAGELYANAGTPGVLLGFAAFGTIAGIIRRRAVNASASGDFVVYAAAITILFAIFADYFGQFYRGGALLVGVAASLILGGERRLSVSRAALAISGISIVAATLLIARKVIGGIPPFVLTSTWPAYFSLGVVASALCLRAYYHPTVWRKRKS
jgi:hypothetical protein